MGEMENGRTTAWNAVGNVPRPTDDIVPPEQQTKVAEQIKSAAKDQAENARTQIRSLAETGKDRIADQLENVARALKSSGQSLESDEQQAPISQYADMIGDRIEQASRYLREHEAIEFVDRIEGVARRQPLLFVGGAFAIGLALGRLFRASSSEIGGSVGSLGGSGEGYGSEGYGGAGSGTSGVGGPGIGTSASAALGSFGSNVGPGDGSSTLGGGYGSSSDGSSGSGSSGYGTSSYGGTGASPNVQSGYPMGRDVQVGYPEPETSRSPGDLGNVRSDVASRDVSTSEVRTSTTDPLTGAGGIGRTPGSDEGD